MNIRQLEAFKAAMELGSFTRAAERLHLTQPAISKLILQLERTCGFSLFRRQNNRVTPTVEAEMLFSEVERVFLNVESVAARARAIRDFEHGDIQIVAFPSLCAHVLPTLLARFMLKHPGVKVELSARNSWLLVDRVASQGVDIGFGMVAPERSGVRFQKLCAVDAVCVMSPTHPLAEREVITPKDLADEPFISMLEEDRCQLQIDAVFAAEGIERNIVMKAQLTEACCAFAATGLGVSLVDPMSTVAFSAEELAVKPFTPTIEYSIWVVSPEYRQLSKAAEALIAFMGNHLQRQFGAGLPPNHTCGTAAMAGLRH